MQNLLTEQQVFQFIRDGFLVLPQLASQAELTRLIDVTRKHKQLRQQPFELEVDVAYPGSPKSADAAGGDTIRRLLHAYTREQCFRDWAEKPEITSSIRQLLRSKQLYLNENHHNCVMTKEPRFSSQTNWHRDTRYWSFNNKYLINSWLALGSERSENGGMLMLPGSHRWDIEEGALDQEQFLKEDYPSNQARLSLAQHVNLEAGDCLLFSAHCFHAAGRNQTNDEKYSLVFTYHGESTQGKANTKSSIKKPVKVL